jgi:hypothetical protein
MSRKYVPSFLKDQLSNTAPTPNTNTNNMSNTSSWQGQKPSVPLSYSNKFEALSDNFPMNKKNKPIVNTSLPAQLAPKLAPATLASLTGNNSVAVVSCGGGGPKMPWCWYSNSYNPNITMDIIEKNPNKSWYWHYILYNPNLTMEFIEKNPDKLLDWSVISYNSNITMETIERNPTKPWNWNAISKNPNLTINFIEKYLEKDWNWNAISSNPFNDMYDEIQERWSGRLLLVQARNRIR